MEERIITVVEALINAAGQLPWRVILAMVAGSGFAIGLFLVIKPAYAIRMQQKFYEKINWKMEPISLQKEIRNTRLMGIFLLGILIAVLLLLAGAGKTFF